MPYLQESKAESKRREMPTHTKKSFFDSLSWQDEAIGQSKQEIKNFPDLELESGLLSGSDNEDDFFSLTNEQVKGMRNGNSEAPQPSPDVDLLFMVHNTQKPTEELFSTEKQSQEQNDDLFSGTKSDNKLLDFSESGDATTSTGKQDFFSGKYKDVLNIGQPSRFVGTEASPSSYQQTYDPFKDFPSTPQQNDTSSGTFDPFETSTSNTNCSKNKDEDEFIKMMESRNSNNGAPDLLGNWNSANVVNLKTFNMPGDQHPHNLRQSHSASNLGGMNTAGPSLSGGFSSQQNILSASQARPAKQSQQSAKLDPFADLGKWL